MKLVCVGLNWKTPVRIRERLAFDSAKQQDALGRLLAAHPAQEFVLLSTCNRTEIYAASPAGVPEVGVEDLTRFVSQFHQLPMTEFFDHLYFHEDAGTAFHLFQVSAGLDSLILGEVQIAGQVKQAYQSAVDCRCARRGMHLLFQRAFGVAKRVQTETTLGKGRLSVASAAVDYVRGVFESLTDKTVLVLGAGKMAELVLTHLAEHEPRRILVLNRTRDRAEALASRFQGATRDWSELHSALVDADIILSSTGSEEPIVTRAMYAQVMVERQYRLSAIVDIAVPRDFETSIADLENVLLWNIDHLEKIRQKTLRSREKELDKALRIVETELVQFEAAVAAQESGPVIGQLEAEFQRILEQELEWLMPQLGELDAEQQSRIRQFAHRLKNKFLHPPKAALRDAAREGRGSGLFELVRKLFGLPDEVSRANRPGASTTP